MNSELTRNFCIPCNSWFIFFHQYYIIKFRYEKRI